MMYQKSIITMCMLVLVFLSFSCDSPLVEDPEGNNPTEYTVTFESNGGSVVAQQSVESGSKIIPPADPTRANSTFEGWYKESTLDTAWDFDTDTVSQDITLYHYCPVNFLKTSNN
ncbi:MAG: InlB B-repeat-containing protein [Sphaerochaetaceae bacterium]|nr:InlB B-repeat-containing protein [Sphaerochaetaceae bacterium]